MASAKFAGLRHLRFETLEARNLLAALPPLVNGRIAWHSYTDYGALDGRIHVYDFDDSAFYPRATTTIAAAVTHAHNPNFSVDGRYITFMGLPAGPAYGGNWRQYLDVFIYDFVTDDVTNLSAQLGLDDPGELEEDPVFSPDGNKIAFKRNLANIWEADVYALTVRQLTAGAGERSGPQYSSDGSQLIFWVGSGASSYLGQISLQGMLPAVPATLRNNLGVQDYFPSYWGADRVLYTSWRNSTQQDDDVKFWNSATQVDAFAAFNSTQAEDSDPFGITTTLVGFSTNRGSSKWQLWYGDPVTGDAASLNISQGGKHNLGAEYTLHKVTYQPPSADFDGDGDVDGHDFLTWQRGHGISAPHATGSDGDADHNLTVNALDLGVWQIQYGGGVLGTLREYTQLNQTAVDLAMQVYGAAPWPYSLLSENDGAEAPSLDSSPTRDSGWLSSESRETGTWKSTTPTALDASSINSSIDDAIDKSSSENESANSLELSSDIFAW